MSNDIIFYTQIGSILGYVALLFGLYRVLVRQKDGVIELLREENRQLASKTPDALVAALSSRVNVTLDEIERLRNEGEEHQGQIAEKEELLAITQERLHSLTEMLRETDLVCPQCSAPLSERHHQIIHGYVGGREAEADVTYCEYECGYTAREGGEEISPCRNS